VSTSEAYHCGLRRTPRTGTSIAVTTLVLATGCAAPLATGRVATTTTTPTVALSPAAPVAHAIPVETASFEVEAEVELPVPVEARAAPIPIGKGTRVLIFGDSMVTSGLGTSLEARVVARGGKFFSVSKGSSTTTSWNEGRELQDLLVLTHPDVVIVVLGANELFVPNPRARIHDIRGIVRRIGARSCLWIGPSPWRPEKGILGVIQETSAPCRFFDSTPLDIVKGTDGIHPTLQGGRSWADAVWEASFAE